MFGKSEKNNIEVSDKSTDEEKNTQLSKSTPFEEMDRIFDQFLSNRWLHPFNQRFPEMPTFGLSSQLRVPSVDVVEKDKNILVRAEIPGIDKKDIEINLSGNQLTIQGKNKHETSEDKEGYHYREISSASFSRILTLPCQVTSKGVKATFKNGLLEINMPKSEEGNGNQIKVE